MLFEVATSVVLLTVASLVIGLPLALLALRRVDTTLMVRLAVASGLGTVTWLLIGLPAVHLGWFSASGVGTVGVVVAVVAWSFAWRDLAALRPRRPGWLAAWLTLLAVPAAWLRSDPIYFAYQVADFGEYVNRGNVVADGGRFGGWFVNLFPLAFAESHLLLGEARSVHLMPFLGLLLVALMLALVHLVSGARLVVGLLAIPLALHVHAVWFSQFPASETLFAVLLVLSVVCGVVAIAQHDHVVAVAGGLIGFPLILTRGNGLVLLPLAVLGLVLAPLLTDLARTSVARSHMAALAAGLWAGSLYNSRFNGTYFLDQQTVPMLPEPVGELVGRWDEPAVAAVMTVLFTVGLASVWWVSVVVGRRAARRTGRVPPARIAFVALVVLAVVGLHLFVITAIGYQPRYDVLGPVFGLAVVVAVAAALLHPDPRLDGTRRFALMWPLVLGLVFVTFHAGHMGKSTRVDAPWFLYWDRYFFSEAFPMLLLAGGVGGAVIASTLRARSGRKAMAVAGVAAVLAVTVASADMIRPTLRSQEQAMFADAYGELATIDRMMVEDLPVIYHGFTERPPGFFWQNSSRVLADPLAETFGRRVLNRAGALGSDPRPSDAEIVELLESVDADEAYVLQVSGPEGWREITTPALETDVVDELFVQFERLDGKSRTAPESQEWIDSHLYVRVVHVRSATAGLASGST